MRKNGDKIKKKFNFKENKKMKKVYLYIVIFLGTVASCKETEVVAAQSNSIDNVNPKKIDALIPETNNGVPQLIENDMENRKPIKTNTPKK